MDPRAQSPSSPTSMRSIRHPHPTRPGMNGAMSAETIAPGNVPIYGHTTPPRATPMSDLTGHAAKMEFGGSDYPIAHGTVMSRCITPGGSPMDTSQPAFPEYHRKYGNPSPLGLLGMAGTNFILALYNLRARGVETNNAMLGMMIFYGGMAQVIAGIQDWFGGNTFGATAFTSYGCFWLSNAMLYLPALGIRASYVDAQEYRDAVGIYLLSWTVITFIFLLACFRSSIALVLIFVFLDLTYVFSVAANMANSLVCTKIAGVFGLLTALMAMYTALAGMLTKDTSDVIIPVGNLSRAST